MRCPSELYLRHKSVDEALPLLEKFLDKAFMADLQEVSVVHGKGSGKLREAVHAKLTGHSLVDSFSLAEPARGGMGVTLIHLAARHTH